MIIKTDFNQNKTSSPQKKNRIDENLNKPFYLLILCIILLILVVLYGIFRNYFSNYNSIKEDKSKDLVYTISNNEKVKIPHINLKSSSISLVNTNIEQYCNQYTNATVSYEYYISGNYLTVLITALEENDDSLPQLNFQTFNINLKRQSYISEEDLLKYFNVTEDYVSAKIYNKFLDYYNEEIEKGYVSSKECSFECFLNYREVEDYLDSVVYGIKDGQLYAFKPFTYVSILGEENYFTEKSFYFQITG